MLVGRPFGFHLQEIAPVAWVFVQPEAVEFENRVADHFEEEAVVRDHEQRGLGPGEEALQPLNHAEVEVVGGLVQEQQVRLLDEALGQRDPALFSAAEVVHETIGVVEAEFSEDFLGLRLVAPSVGPVHGVVSGLQGFGVLALGGLLVLANGAHGVVVRFKQVGENRPVEVEPVVLGEVGNAGLPVEGHGAGIGAFDVEQHLHEGAFARSVSGDQGCLLALVQSEVEVLENEPLAKPLGQPLHRKHISACHGAKVAARAR